MTQCSGGKDQTSASVSRKRLQTEISIFRSVLRRSSTDAGVCSCLLEDVRTLAAAEGIPDELLQELRSVEELAVGYTHAAQGKFGSAATHFEAAFAGGERSGRLLAAEAHLHCAHDKLAAISRRWSRRDPNRCSEVELSACAEAASAAIALCASIREETSDFQADESIPIRIRHVEEGTADLLRHVETLKYAKQKEPAEDRTVGATASGVLVCGRNAGLPQYLRRNAWASRGLDIDASSSSSSSESSCHSGAQSDSDTEEKGEVHEGNGGQVQDVSVGLLGSQPRPASSDKSRNVTFGMEGEVRDCIGDEKQDVSLGLSDSPLHPASSDKSRTVKFGLDDSVGNRSESSLDRPKFQFEDSLKERRDRFSMTSTLSTPSVNTLTGTLWESTDERPRSLFESSLRQKESPQQDAREKPTKIPSERRKQRQVVRSVKAKVAATKKKGVVGTGGAIERYAKERVLDAFRTWDVNQNGNISLSEMQDVLGALGLGGLAVPKLFERMDLNGNGSVDYNEFVCWIFDATPKEKKASGISCKKLKIEDSAANCLFLLDDKEGLRWADPRAGLRERALADVLPGERASHPLRAEAGFLVLQHLDAGAPGEGGIDIEVVKRVFFDSMPQSGVKIESIARVAQRDHLRRFWQRLDGRPSVVEVAFHGTEEGRVQDIISNGLTTSAAGTGRGAYGMAAYVGAHAGLAHKYAIPNEAGQRHMFCILAEMRGFAPAKTNQRQKGAAAGPSDGQFCFCLQDSLCVAHLVTYRVLDPRPLSKALAKAVLRAGGGEQEQAGMRIQVVQYA